MPPPPPSASFLSSPVILTHIFYKNTWPQFHPGVEDCFFAKFQPHMFLFLSFFVLEFPVDSIVHT